MGINGVNQSTDPAEIYNVLGEASRTTLVSGHRGRPDPSSDSGFDTWDFASGVDFLIQRLNERQYKVC